VVLKVVQETATQNIPPAKRARWNWKKYTSNKKRGIKIYFNKKYTYDFMCRSNIESRNTYLIQEKV
jgi:hypothetical protein